MNVPAKVAWRGEIVHPERAQAVAELSTFLTDHEDQVLEILTEVTCCSAVRAEIASSLKALAGATIEVETRQPRSVARMAVFMPSNMILYSYVLYLVIPSLFVREIDFRPSSYVIAQTEKLHALLGPVHNLPLHLKSVSQKDFMERSVGAADVVTFTGTYSNAEKIKMQLRKDQLYIFFGQGVNPFVISECADIEAAVKDLVSVRLFNTGQDCLGPDAIFVHKSIANEFMQKLEGALQQLVFGSRKDPDADYSPIYYASTLEILSKYFMANAHFIVRGGIVDFGQQKIEPTVLLGSLKKRPDTVEFFGPVFNVILYESDRELIAELEQPFYRDRAMGASVYGKEVFADVLRRYHSVSLNATLFDIEDGNSPFGGYGPMANYVHYQGQLKIAPILISQTVADLM